MNECRQLDRSELIKKPRRSSRSDGTKSLYSVQSGIQGDNLRIFYIWTKKINAFPCESLISGIRMQKNVGEIITPSKAVRVARQPPVGGSGCLPCNAPRSCVLHQSGALQTVKQICLQSINFDPATNELDIGSWYVTYPPHPPYPPHPELSQAGSLKQTHLVDPATE